MYRNKNTRRNTFEKMSECTTQEGSPRGALSTKKFVSTQNVEGGEREREQWRHSSPNQTNAQRTDYKRVLDVFEREGDKIIKQFTKKIKVLLEQFRTNSFANKHTLCGTWLCLQKKRARNHLRRQERTHLERVVKLSDNDMCIIRFVPRRSTMLRDRTTRC